MLSCHTRQPIIRSHAKTIENTPEYRLRHISQCREANSTIRQNPPLTWYSLTSKIPGNGTALCSETPRSRTACTVHTDPPVCATNKTCIPEGNIASNPADQNGTCAQTALSYSRRCSERAVMEFEVNSEEEQEPQGPSIHLQQDSTRTALLPFADAQPSSAANRVDKEEGCLATETNRPMPAGCLAPETSASASRPPSALTLAVTTGTPLEACLSAESWIPASTSHAPLSARDQSPSRSAWPTSDSETPKFSAQPTPVPQPPSAPSASTQQSSHATPTDCLKLDSRMGSPPHCSRSPVPPSSSAPPIPACYSPTSTAAQWDGQWLVRQHHSPQPPLASRCCCPS